MGFPESNENRENQNKVVYYEDNPPPSIEAAEERREELVEAIESIMIQLADKTRKTRIDPETDMPISREKYEKWRHRAKIAMVIIKRELRFLKKWIKDRNSILNQPGSHLDFDLADPTSLIFTSYQVFAMLKKKGIFFDDDEWRVVMGLKKYLESVGQI